MKASVTVREYARLTTGPVDAALGNCLDSAQIPQSAFDWLCELSASFRAGGAALVQIENRRWLKLDNYVGVLESPCGTRLEILPKHVADGDCEFQSRALLRTMIQHALDLNFREVGPASLQVFNAPLSEWVMQQFLLGLDHLIKRGLRLDYQCIEEEARFLRGRLDVARQMRQPPGRQHHFQIKHDLFLPDRPENRLLKLALERVCASTQDAGNWRLANELRSMLLEIPASTNAKTDFRQWRCDRLMAHYEPIRPWCELILNQQMPMAVSGDWNGISLLFPMEKLFERYVASCLRRQLSSAATLESQVARRFLCLHDGGRMFRLEPDLLITQGKHQWVLDTKWKLLDAANKENKYGLSQADFYQVFAYGQKYLGGEGDMVLIYPKHQSFSAPLPPFSFTDTLRLWAVPFCLEHGRLLVPPSIFPWHDSSDLQGAA